MGYKQYRKKTAPHERTATEVKTYLPQSLYQLLRAKSEKLKLPMSRLIAYAVDKEFDEGEAAFSYDCEDPTTVFVEGSYVDEGGRIYRYLVKCGMPMSKDQIMLSRRDIGIPDKMTLLLGLRELTSRETLVEMIRSSFTKFSFADDYRVIAIKTTANEKKKKEIEKAERHLAKLKGQKYGGPIGTEASSTENSEE